MLIIIFWKLNIVKATSKKTRALIYSMKFFCPEAAVNLYVANLSFLFVLNPWFVVKNVIKLVKYALCFKYVEGALTSRLNLFHFFIFADFFPPTARIWNFWLPRHIFLTCSLDARVKKYLVLFSPFKSVSFFFFTIFLTLVTLYFEVVQHIYMECTKFDKKALIRFHCTS